METSGKKRKGQQNNEVARKRNAIGEKRRKGKEGKATRRGEGDKKKKNRKESRRQEVKGQVRIQGQK